MMVMKTMVMIKMGIMASKKTCHIHTRAGEGIEDCLVFFSQVIRLVRVVGCTGLYWALLGCIGLY